MYIVIIIFYQSVIWDILKSQKFFHKTKVYNLFYFVCFTGFVEQWLSNNSSTSCYKRLINSICNQEIKLFYFNLPSYFIWQVLRRWDSESLNFSQISFNSISNQKRVQSYIIIQGEILWPVIITLKNPVIFQHWICQLTTAFSFQNIYYHSYAFY